MMAVGSGVVPRDVPGAIPSPGVDVSGDGPSGAGGTGDSHPAATKWHNFR